MHNSVKFTLIIFLWNETINSNNSVITLLLWSHALLGAEIACALTELSNLRTDDMLSSASGEKRNLGPNLDMDRPGRRLIFLLILPFCTPITVAPVPDVDIDRLNRSIFQNWSAEWISRFVCACDKFSKIRLTCCLFIHFLSSGGRFSYALRARHRNVTSGDEMKRCTRCNKRRGLLDRIFGLDNEFCDDCLLTVNLEIREKRAVSAPAGKSRKRSIS